MIRKLRAVHLVKSEAGTNRILTNSVNLMLASGITAAFGFVFWIVVAHNFHSTTVGIATTLLSVSQLIALLGMAGFDTIFVRILPKSKRKSELINSGLIVSGVVSGLLALAFCLLSPTLSPRLGFLEHHVGYMVEFVVFTIFTTWNSLTNAILVAYRRTGFVLLIDGIFSAVKVSLPFLATSGNPMTIFTFVGIAQVVNVVLSIGALVGFSTYRPRLKMHIGILRETARYGSGMYAASLLNLLPDSLLPIIVIDKLGSSQAAYFYVAFAVSNLIYTIAFATNQVLLAEAAADEEHFTEHARRGLLLSSVMLTPVVLIMVAFAPFVLSFFGHSYSTQGTELLRIMSASGLLVMVYSFISFIFKHTKNLKGIIAMTSVNAVVIISLAISLAKYGLTGIGLSWLIGTAVAVVVGLVALKIPRKRTPQHAKVPGNILITHVYSEDNKGDAALLSVLLSDLRSSLSTPSITILTLDALNDTNSTFDATPVRNSFMFYALKKYRNRPMILLFSLYVMNATLLWAIVYRFSGKALPLPRDLRHVANQYRDADLIVPVGGGYLRGQKKGIGSLLNVALLLHPYIFSRIVGKPTVLYSQSIGPFSNSLEEKLVTKVLSGCVNAAIIREDTSMALLERIGVRCPLYRSVDSGFAFRSVGESFNVRDRLQIPSTRMLFGITARKWLNAAAQEDYESALAATIEHIVHNVGAAVILIPQVTSEFHKDDDRLVQQRIVSRLASTEHVYALDDKLNHHEIKNIYDSLDLLLGTRFHSVIFSLTSYVPAIAIEYEHKTGGIMHDLGLDEWVIKMEDVQANKLISMVDRLVQERSAYRRHLKKVLPSYVRRTEEPVRILLDTYESVTTSVSL